MKLSRIASLPLIALCLITALLAFTLLACGYLEAWHMPYFEQRYASTLALAHGQTIYQTRPSAPLFCAIYGPLSYVAFLPATLLPSVMTIFVAGSLLATAFLVVPFAFAAYSFAKTRDLILLDWGPLVLLALTAVGSLHTLNYVASHVTADSPAIGLMALAALLLYFHREQPRWTIAAWSSLATVLSIGCKQNMIIGGFVIALGVWFCFPRRFWWTFIAWIAAFSLAAVGAVIAIYHDLGAIYFNNVVIPSRYPVIVANLFPGTYRLFESTAVLLLTFTGMSLIWFLTKGSQKWPRVSPFILTFFGISAALALPSIRIYAASGGDVNDFAHATYFLLMGVFVAGGEVIVLNRSQPQAVSAMRILTVVAALTLLGAGLPTRYTAEWKEKMRQTPAAVQAYEYCKRNPGHVYFPYNTIGVYFAERKFYHTEWGVMIPVVAGERFTREEIFKYIPENAQYLALPRGYIPDHRGMLGALLVARDAAPVNIAGLEAFDVYPIERKVESAESE
jgi:hypothetical protein